MAGGSEGLGEWLIMTTEMATFSHPSGQNFIKPLLKVTGFGPSSLLGIPGKLKSRLQSCLQ